MYEVVILNDNQEVQEVIGVFTDEKKATNFVFYAYVDEEWSYGHTVNLYKVVEVEKSEAKNMDHWPN